MSGQDADRLYNLLPAVYRLADSDEDESLRALLRVIAAEAGKIERDIAGLYDNWFIETCDEWVVPYIGDLLGVQGLHAFDASAFSQRAYVANTLAYRRRKGTAAVLEQLARDVTNWPARAVEFFQLLGTTQNVNHVRLQNIRTPDLRDINRLGLLDTPFDTIAHSGEVRRIASRRGRHNIPNVGLFLWRLQAYPIENAAPHPAADPPDGRYTFTSLGYDSAPFTRFVTETEIGQLADETNVPGPIRVAAFYFDLQDYQRKYASVLPQDRPTDTATYGPNRSINIATSAGGAAPFVDVPPIAVVCMDLRNWDRPPAGHVGIDVRLGRLAFAAGETPAAVRVNTTYGFSADIGGGPYERRRGRALPPLTEAEARPPDTVAVPSALGFLIRVPSQGIASLTDALNAWDRAAHPKAVIQVDDNGTYVEDVAVAMPAADDGELVIQAANEMRPTLVGDVTVTGGSGTQALTINGLLVAGAVTVQANLASLDLVHTTLVPGRRLDAEGQPVEPARPSLVVAADDGGRPINDGLSVTIDHCIVGPLRLPAKLPALVVRDSIIDAPARRLSALVSGVLSPFPDLSFPSPGAGPTMQVTIGSQGPFPAVLRPPVPTSLAQARDALQAAIRAAHPTPAFTEARVLSVANRLVILPGAAGDIHITPPPGDPTAERLRLDPASSRLVFPLIVPAAAGDAGRSMTMRLESGETHAAELPDREQPQTPAQARTALQAAIRGAHPAPAFAQALVATLDDRLVILPGVARATVDAGPAAIDESVLTTLALADERPALASSVPDEPGPTTTLERVTVFGVVRVKELTLASETIFTAPAIAQRRQAGCVRFSYVAPGSQTPQRFRCQPDLEVAAETDAAGKRAQAAGVPMTESDKAALRAHILAWLTPSFTDTRYGRPAYAQLGQVCPPQIAEGAEDGSEMGAFASLKQPQRVANLRAALDEYLRFGLEAGILFVT